MNTLLLFADLILILHFAFVLGIIIPVPLILIGARRGWKWIRARRFRLIHLAMMGIVMVEAIIGMFCPLTVWEQELRKRAGAHTYEGSFIAHWVGQILYYDFEPWVFTLLYLTFGAIIFGLYRWVPPYPSQWRDPPQ